MKPRPRIPDRARRRELHVLGGDWRDVLDVSIGTASELFASADPELLVRLDPAPTRSTAST